MILSTKLDLHSEVLVGFGRLGPHFLDEGVDEGAVELEAEGRHGKNGPVVAGSALQERFRWEETGLLLLQEPV